MILVTGATGLVGSHLIYDLISSGKKVRALRRNTSNTESIKKIFALYTDKPQAIFDKIEWVQGDMLDYFSLEEALEGVSKIYHTAATVSFNKKHKHIIHQTNVDGTRNLVNLAIEKNIEKFCFVSSTAALATPEDKNSIIDEELSWSPEKKRSNYSLSKFKSELEVWRGIEEGLNAVIVNPGVILGVADWNKGSARIFSTVKKGLNYYTKGITAYVYVNDLTKAMIMLMDSNISNQRFIISEGNYSFQQIFAYISKAFGILPAQKYASPKLTNIAWRLSALKSFFTSKPSTLTKETARSAHNISKYSNQKIKDAINIKFTPIQTAINQIAKHYDE